MTKAEIVKKISQQTGIEQTAASAVVEAFMEQVRQALIGGENVYLRGFGTFNRKHRAEKVARNISKNTTIKVPAHDIPAFKPSKEFLDKIK
ncbi:MULTISPECIES: HU family DNA-binding protein [unclassified Alistipes]|uniref:HU family DNA-binding protein n=1 Tax=unclassified Alistipes TaxID=2608932 RepID=UPI0007A891A4|nr:MULTISPECIES: HU family DNA-binding protein [unclassified Alistipes]CVI66366.1 DNA-binding protein HU [Alistipes sp. CHKCI003]HAW64854.1 integration host factor subunit beta [Alistipes sp.]